MAYAFKRWIRKFKQINYRWLAALVLFIFCILSWVYYWRAYLEKTRVQWEIGIVTQILSELDLTLREEKNDNEYKKYQAAKTVMDQAWNMNWNENIEYLVDLLDELTELDTIDNTVKLENFQISDDTINLKWSVYSIESMYKEWWVIDKFESFEFITNIKIPSYKKNEELGEIDFVLDATIQQYEW